MLYHCVYSTHELALDSFWNRFSFPSDKENWRNKRDIWTKFCHRVFSCVSMLVEGQPTMVET
jgi:hypothetical protein